jgi:hypothetical protein
MSLAAPADAILNVGEPQIERAYPPDRVIPLVEPPHGGLSPEPMQTPSV